VISFASSDVVVIVSDSANPLARRIAITTFSSVTLIVSPTSIVSQVRAVRLILFLIVLTAVVLQWRDEIEKHAPSLKVFIYDSARRSKVFFLL
jgi:hypothetical protein